MSKLKIGIASFEQMKERTMCIARGEHEPSADEPKIWFPSIETAAKVLSERNRALLALIASEHPASLTELAELSGRAKSNLSRTLKTMEKYGLVDLTKGSDGRIKPHVPYSDIELDVRISNAFG